jgi:hypothetical protein
LVRHGPAWTGASTLPQAWEAPSGRLPSSAAQLTSSGNRPLLTVDDRGGPMFGARRGHATPPVASLRPERRCAWRGRQTPAQAGPGRRIPRRRRPTAAAGRGSSSRSPAPIPAASCTWSATTTPPTSTLRSGPGSPATPASGCASPNLSVVAQPSRGVLLHRGPSGAAPRRLHQRHRPHRRHQSLLYRLESALPAVLLDQASRRDPQQVGPSNHPATQH